MNKRAQTISLILLVAITSIVMVSLFDLDKKTDIETDPINISGVIDESTKPLDESPVGNNEISEEKARELIIEKYGDCEEWICSELLIKILSWNKIEAIHNLMADDSVRAYKTIVSIELVENKREITEEISKESKCQPGRWHQDFSTDTCI